MGKNLAALSSPIALGQPMKRKGYLVCMQLLKSIIEADEQVTDEENIFLERLYEKMGLSSDERATVDVPLDREEAIVLLKGLADPVRKGIFQTLAFASMVDGQLDDRERNFIVQLGEAVGLEDAWVSALWHA
jgi:hypothetical protein